MGQSRPLLLDLFCGEGGAAIGYRRAGFDVVGVDIRAMPRYPFTFIKQDVTQLTLNLKLFDAIHASPPCQEHSTLRALWNVDYPDLISYTRALLESADCPTVIENVAGAPLKRASTICGAAMGNVMRLPQGGYYLRRHRLFETDWSMTVLPCKCDHYRAKGYQCVGVYGTGTHQVTKRDEHGRRAVRSPAETGMTVAMQRKLMGMPHGSARTLSQAIPPSYTWWVGTQLLALV